MTILLLPVVKFQAWGVLILARCHSLPEAT
jgi:hypothetical protein